MSILDYKDINSTETQEWLDSIQEIIDEHGEQRAQFIIQILVDYMERKGVRLPFNTNTPYINTIQPFEEPKYPGDKNIERRIKSIIRWNAMAMVVKANKEVNGIGGHISSYASAATLYEVGFNHFFKGDKHPDGPDMLYIQGHCSPGIYARSFVEGRFSEEHLSNFRQELSSNK